MPDLYVLDFKGNRKDYYFNTFYHSLRLRDYVIVQSERGEDMGLLNKKVMKELDFSDTEKPCSILRPASEEDRRNLIKNRVDEQASWNKVMELIDKHKLEMKLVDIEYQFDRNKMTFYFTAEHRVDFRALVRDLAAEYKTRIELRQIGVRDEAKRIGGFGICGLQQCCCSFLKDFDPISTGDARVQGLSLNPTKISGNCGRLLCCLKYESAHYAEVRSKYPEIGERYSTPTGEGVIDRINVFEDYMVVKHENGEEVKVYGSDLKKKERKQTSFFQKWREALKIDKTE
ncbi:MAG: regulatory iron-sulfur-containing complex subunit RicT [candidate division Zixibacteria bacterium]|jgi:cell fate regulator YaaT (PSP1 superfamily)|nr:regulatory iron-sulfur-containing complex subunit RicT [candidate division Zixibacteria bacterium]